MEKKTNRRKITSVSSFFELNEGGSAGSGERFFVRCVGTDERLLKEILAADEKMGASAALGTVRYRRVTALPKLCRYEDAQNYAAVYEAVSTGSSGVFGQNSASAERMREALLVFEEKYRRASPGCSETMVKNFLTKLLFWADGILDIFLGGADTRSVSKLAVSGKIGLSEYLFCSMAVFLGIDVILYLPEGEIALPEWLLEESQQLLLGECSRVDLPEYTVKLHPRANENAAGQKNPGENAAGKTLVRVKIPQRPSQKAVEAAELTFEELAAKASSVVMITIHDGKGEVLGTGSGIMISKDGYILTNNHVASGGCYYSVRIEEDEQIYRTDEVIKYNSVLDLALIRIGRSLRPIPIYNGKKELARGQKVVAIGSPLGFFNSVSDGIISGFRDIDHVDMIQFTAPTSPGSSGGALLNMQGEVIGISTAGVDSGQNINLAVNYKDIRKFLNGFI